MIYRIQATINFDVEAGSRAEAHVEGASRLIEADLPGFELGGLTVGGHRPDDASTAAAELLADRLAGRDDARAKLQPGDIVTRPLAAARPILAGTEIGSFTADKDGWYDVGTNPPRYLGPDRPGPQDACTYGADCRVHPGVNGLHNFMGPIEGPAIQQESGGAVDTSGEPDIDVRWESV